MAKKDPLTVHIPAALRDAFYEIAPRYGHGKQKGQVLSAAIVLLLEADPAEVEQLISQIADAERFDRVREWLAKRGPQEAEPPPKKQAGRAAS